MHAYALPNAGLHVGMRGVARDRFSAFTFKTIPSTPYRGARAWETAPWPDTSAHASCRESRSGSGVGYRVRSCLICFFDIRFALHRFSAFPRRVRKALRPVRSGSHRANCRRVAPVSRVAWRCSRPAATIGGSCAATPCVTLAIGAQGCYLHPPALCLM